MMSVKRVIGQHRIDRKDEQGAEIPKPTQQPRYKGSRTLGVQALDVGAILGKVRQNRGDLIKLPLIGTVRVVWARGQRSP